MIASTESKDTNRPQGKKLVSDDSGFISVEEQMETQSKAEEEAPVTVTSDKAHGFPSFKKIFGLRLAKSGAEDKGIKSSPKAKRASKGSMKQSHSDILQKQSRLDDIASDLQSINLDSAQKTKLDAIAEDEEEVETESGDDYGSNQFPISKAKTTTALTEVSATSHTKKWNIFSAFRRNASLHLNRHAKLRGIGDPETVTTFARLPQIPQEIIAPGRLPPSTVVLYTPSSRTEEEDKVIRRANFISVLRGVSDLPTQISSKYKISQVIGDGAFGFVVAAKMISNPEKEVAIKFIFKEKVSKECWVEDPTYGWIPFECHFLSRVQHENIIDFVEVVSDSKYIYFVTELHGTEWTSGNPALNPDASPAEIIKYNQEKKDLSQCRLERMSDQEIFAIRRTSLDLFECIDYHRSMPEDKCRIVFAQLVNVVDYLDSLGYVHRDLKDENIVVDEKYKIKLIDFGSCAKIPKKGDKANYFDRFNGTLHFASPEILMGQHYRGPEAEVWSMGVILYTMLYGMNPFQKPDDIVKGKVKYPTQGIHVDLMIKMFEQDPEKRISLEEIKKHPYVAAYLA